MTWSSTRTATWIVELDLAQQQARAYGGGYAAYLAERDQRDGTRAPSSRSTWSTRSARQEQRARSQRAWIRGVRNAGRKKTDNDKFVAKFRAGDEREAGGQGAETERSIQRLDVVDEPRKEWDLRMDIGAPQRARSWPRCAGPWSGGCHLRPGGPADRLG